MGIFHRLNCFSRFVETTAVVHDPPKPPPEYRGGSKGSWQALPPCTQGRMKRIVAGPSPLYSGGAKGG